VAERLELVHQVAGLAVAVDAAGVVVGAEVVEPCGGIGEQVPDDHQDGTGHSDQGLCQPLAPVPPPTPLALPVLTDQDRIDPPCPARSVLCDAPQLYPPAL
jgi:hypothetical protein